MQVPPFYSIPEYASTAAGEEAIELAAMAGLELDPWQQYVIKNGMAERADGKWAAFLVAYIVSRQNGKGSIAEARQLAGLYLINEALQLASAHEFKTAGEGFRRILYLIENTPDLDRRVKRVTRSHGEEGIELKNGNRLRFVARSRGSGRGFSGDCVYLDEAMILSEEAMGALLPTLSARPNPQVWIYSSAGTEDSAALGRIVHRGRRGEDPSMAFFEWAADEGDDPTDESTWAKANPGLGIRISSEHIARELAAMDPISFGRERLGIGSYPAEGGDEWSVLSETTWSALTDYSSELRDPVAFAIDMSADRTMATIAAAGSRSDGLAHVEIVQHGAGSGWVVPRMKELQDRWRPVAVAVDAGGPAGSLIGPLEAAGVTVKRLQTRDMAQACGAFYDAAMAQSLRHLGQLDLNLAVRGARKRPLGDAWAWSRRDSSVNLSPLVAATLALHAHGAKDTRASVGVWSFDDFEED